MPGFAFGSDDINSGIGPNSMVNTARVYRWKIEKLGPVSANSISGINTQWYAKSLTFPTIGASVEEAMGSSIKYKFAGFAEFSTCTVVLYNIITRQGTSIKTFLEEWFGSVYGDQLNRDSGLSYNKIHVADNYKDSSIFSITDETGASQTRLTLHNSWPLKISHNQLDYSKNELAELTVELIFDWASDTGSKTRSTNTAPNNDTNNSLNSRLSQ